MTPKFQTGDTLLGSWMTDVERGEPPVRFALAQPFDRLDLRPGRLLLFGGAPGHGKTAAILQTVVDLLRLNPSARVLVANVEMTPTLLLERAVSRLSGVPLTPIADRTLKPEQLECVRIGVQALEQVADRLAFLSAPYSLVHLAAAADAFGAHVLVVDYVQRFAAGDGSKTGREELEEAATVLRRFCDQGACVLAVSAVARQKGVIGSTYAGLGLASFRGSSELEFGADGAYLLNRPDDGNLVAFVCAKNRHGPLETIVTEFDAKVQTFRMPPSGLAGFDDAQPAPPRKGKGRSSSKGENTCAT